MNDAYYTKDGDRPELAALAAQVIPPEGFIADKIFPIVPVAEKTGTIYYATATTDATAATSRSAGTGPTAVQVSDTAGSFTTVEHITRGGITPDEAKTMGGIDKADEVGAKYAIRNAMIALETDICDIILGKAASDAFDAPKLLGDVQTALYTVSRYDGRNVMIASTATLKKIVQNLLGDGTMGPVFSRLVSGASPAIAATGMNFKAWKDALAMFLGVDEVLAGNDKVWNATSYVGHFAIAKIDDSADPLSAKYRPVLGKNYMFMPDGKIPYQIETVADRVNLNNLYTCGIWFDSKLLNTDALYVFDGVNP
jgi:hypothetical protein